MGRDGPEIEKKICLDCEYINKEFIQTFKLHDILVVRAAMDLKFEKKSLIL